MQKKQKRPQCEQWLSQAMGFQVSFSSLYCHVWFEMYIMYIHCVYIYEKKWSYFHKGREFLDFIFSSIVLNTYSTRLPLICLPSSCTGRRTWLPGSVELLQTEAPCSGRGTFHEPGRNARQLTTALSWSEQGSSDVLNSTPVTSWLAKVIYPCSHQRAAHHHLL